MKQILAKLVFVASLIVANSSYSAGASDLTGVKGTLKNVEKAIKAAISKSEELFEQNAGATLSSSKSLLNSSDSAFISNLSIGTSYDVNLTFSGSSGTAFTSSSSYGSSAKMPIAKALAGSKIRFIPIFESGDNQISSWECITDADSQAKAYMGANVAANEGNTSFISLNDNSGSNDYISNCIYISNVASAFGSSGSGSGSGSTPPPPPPGPCCPPGPPCPIGMSPCPT